MRSHALKVSATVAAVLAAPSAHALEMEYYTWNAFEETVSAFQRVSLVLQDSGFLVFALIFAVIGVVVGLLMTATKGIMGQQLNPVAILIPAAIGVALFRGLVIPTCTMHVYDPVRNAYQAVGDVPDVVILIAGVLNKIERGVVQIIETASADPAAERSGSLRYSLILNSLNAKRQDTTLERNVSSYWRACGIPAIKIGIGGATFTDVLRNSQDLYTQFRGWGVAGLDVVMLTGVGEEDVTVTCAEAWTTYLDPVLRNPAEFQDVMDVICMKSGFDTAVPAQMARCDEELTNLQQLYGLAAVTSLPWLRSIQLAGGISNAMRSGDISVQESALVNRQMMAEGFGVAEAMDRWVPKLRGFMLATVLGLVPLVCLFMLTPVMPKALSLLVGLFLWLTLWGIADSISIAMAADAATDAFDQMNRFGISYDSLMLSPEAAIQAIGVFGKSRTMALMLATVLSYGLFSFGGYAFTSMAQAWQGDLQQAGEAAGRTALLPEQRGAMFSQLASAPATESAIATGGFGPVSAGAAASAARLLGGVNADRPYVGGQVTGPALPGGAGGTSTSPPETTPSTTAPRDGATALGSAGATVGGGAYVSDRLSGITDDGRSLPGGAGGTNTTPQSTAPRDGVTSVGGSSEMGRAALPGGAGGVDTTPWSTAKREGVSASDPRSDGSRADLPGGAGGADTTPWSTAPRETIPTSRVGELRTSPELPGGAGGTDTTPSDITVTARPYRPENYESRDTSVFGLNVRRGELDASTSQGVLAGYQGLAETRDVSLSQAARDTSGFRTSVDVSRTNTTREILDSRATTGAEYGEFRGFEQAAQYDAMRTVNDQINGAGTPLNADSAAELGRATNASLLGQTLVNAPERMVQNAATDAEIGTRSRIEIEKRQAQQVIGSAEGIGRSVSGEAFMMALRAEGERNLTLGEALPRIANAAGAGEVAATPEGFVDSARSIGQVEAAGRIADQQIAERIGEALGEPVETSAGRLRTQEALRGQRSLSLDADQADAFMGRIGASDLQRTMVAGESVSAGISITPSGDMASASVQGGTSVSWNESTRRDYSYSQSGGLMALDNLRTNLIAATHGDPFYGELDEKQQYTIARTIASAIEGTGVGVTASRTETQNNSAGLGGNVGVGGEKGIGSAGFSATAGTSYARSNESSTRAEGLVLEGKRIIEDARKQVIADLARGSSTWEYEISKNDFAERWDSTITRMTLESAERFRKDAEHALESHNPVKDGEEAREDAVQTQAKPSARAATAREMAYQGGQQP